MNHEIPLVSVIIPVYNKEKYIDEFIQSLKQQTLKQAEFIFIDDKGQDASMTKVHEIAKLDKRFICVCNDNNKGPGYSRNKGIETARGEFIAFADADDTIDPNCYELLYKKAKETDALIVKGQHLINENNSVNHSSLLKHIKVHMHSRKSVLNLFTYEHQSAIYSRAWVMQTNARNAEDTRNGEDTCFLMRVTHNLELSKFAIEEKAYYIYRHVGDSLSHSKRDSSYLEQYLRSCLHRIDYMLPLAKSKEEIIFLQTTFERILGNALNECEMQGVSLEDCIHCVTPVALRLEQWKKQSTYRPLVHARLLERLNFNAKLYCEKRSLLLMQNQINELYKTTHDLNKTTQKLKQSIILLSNYKTIKTELFLTKLFLHISFGNLKARLSAKRKALEEKIRPIP